MPPGFSFSDSADDSADDDAPKSAPMTLVDSGLTEPQIPEVTPHGCPW